MHSLGFNNMITPRPTSQSQRLFVLVGRFVRALRVWTSLAFRLNATLHSRGNLGDVLLPSMDDRIWWIGSKAWNEKQTDYC